VRHARRHSTGATAIRKDPVDGMCGCLLGGESLPRRRESRHAVPLL
jgi:hypothetical protein